MAVYNFGVDTDKAWRLTIPDLNVLSKRLTDSEYRMNYRAAMVVAAIYNVNRDPKKRKKPYTPEEILGKGKQETSDMLSMAKRLTEAHDGEISGVV